MPIFCQKNAKCLKNTLFSCPCFVKKTSILSKTRCSHVIFFKFFMEKSLPVMPMFSQKNVNSVKTIGQKVNRIPIFFRIFTIKYCSHGHIQSKNVHSLINALSSRPYLVKKVSNRSKTQCSRVIFSKVSLKTPAVMPIFDQQTSILSKLAYYISQKVNGMPLFLSTYHEKITSLISLFCQKNVNSLKKLCSHAHILSKNILSKTRRSHVFFSPIKGTCSHAHILSKKLYSLKTRRYHVFSLEFSYKTVILSCLNLVKRTLILSKRYYLMGQKNRNEAVFFRF